MSLSLGRLFVVASLPLLLTGISHPLQAQGTEIGGSRWTYLPLNVALGSVSAGVHALIKGAPVVPAVLGGASGGAVMHTGMFLTGIRRPEARFAGIQVQALGANIVRNSGAGIPALSDVILPLYPIYFRIKAVDGVLTPSVTLSAASLIGWVASQSYFEDGRIDWRESARTGALVWESPREFLRCSQIQAGRCTGGAIGIHSLGRIAYVGRLEGEEKDHVMAHEAMHLMQYHRDVLMHAIPVNDVIQRIPAFAWLPDWITWDGFQPLGVSNQLSNSTRSLRWYEIEADAMIGENRCADPKVHCWF